MIQMLIAKHGLIQSIHSLYEWAMNWLGCLCSAEDWPRGRKGLAAAASCFVETRDGASKKLAHKQITYVISNVHATSVPCQYLFYILQTTELTETVFSTMFEMLMIPRRNCCQGFVNF